MKKGDICKIYFLIGLIGLVLIQSPIFSKNRSNRDTKTSARIQETTHITFSRLRYTIDHNLISDYLQNNTLAELCYQSDSLNLDEILYEDRKPEINVIAKHDSVSGDQTQSTRHPNLYLLFPPKINSTVCVSNTKTCYVGFDKGTQKIVYRDCVPPADKSSFGKAFVLVEMKNLPFGNFLDAQQAMHSVKSKTLGKLIAFISAVPILALWMFWVYKKVSAKNENPEAVEA